MPSHGIESDPGSLEKARRVQEVHPYTPVSFETDTEDREEVEMAGVAAGPAVGIDEDISMEIIETTATPDILKLWPWVNQVCTVPYLHFLHLLTQHRFQTPLTVSPQLPLEIVMQLFKRMGYVVSSIIRDTSSSLIQLLCFRNSPRVILVENHGELVGLVTVKDVLRFTAAERHDLRSPWSEQRFDSLVDEAREWTGDLAEDALAWCRRLLGRLRRS